MPMTFMSGQETLKYTHPTNEITAVQDRLNTVTDDYNKRIDEEIHNRELGDIKVLDKTSVDIRLLNDKIEETRNTLLPINNTICNIVISKWFMFINKLFPMVRYRLVNNLVVVVSPLPKWFTRKEVKDEYKSFKKDLATLGLKITDLDVRFEIN